MCAFYEVVSQRLKALEDTSYDERRKEILDGLLYVWGSIECLASDLHSDSCDLEDGALSSSRERRAHLKPVP